MLNVTAKKQWKSQEKLGDGKFQLTKKERFTKMKSVRTVIKARLKRLRLGPYDLAKLVKGKVTAPTVYNFLNGDSEMNTKSLGYILEALDLRIVGGDEVGQE